MIEHTGMQFQYALSPSTSYIINTLCKASPKRDKHLHRMARTLPVPAMLDGWMVDSGSTYHLQDDAAVRSADRYPLSKPVVVRTAQGPLHMMDGATVTIPSLGEYGEKIEVRPLKQCPNVLSLGRLVQ